MPLKMHAAVVEQFGKPLQLQEWDVPAPTAGQILVKTELAAYATPICMRLMAIGR
jgi:D-arabinose 1-dehydrogenase-like Zn-dependent alcohol dehydrogenase